MIGNKVQFKGRNIAVLLLVVLMLALAATPALAWTPVDEDGRSTQFCRVSNEGGELTIHYLRTAQPYYNLAVVEKPLVRPNIAQAEIMSVAAPQIAQISTE